MLDIASTHALSPILVATATICYLRWLTRKCLRYLTPEHGVLLLAPLGLHLFFNYAARPIRLALDPTASIGTIVTGTSEPTSVAEGIFHAALQYAIFTLIVFVSAEIVRTKNATRRRSSERSAPLEPHVPLSLLVALLLLTTSLLVANLEGSSISMISRARREIFAGKNFLLLLIDSSRILYLAFVYQHYVTKRKRYHGSAAIILGTWIVTIDLLTGSRTRLIFLTLSPLIVIGWIHRRTRLEQLGRRARPWSLIALSAVAFFSVAVGLRAHLRDSAPIDSIGGETTAGALLEAPQISVLLDYLSTGREVSGFDYLILVNEVRSRSQSIATECPQPFTDMLTSAAASVPRVLKANCLRERGSHEVSAAIALPKYTRSSTAIATGGLATAVFLGGLPYAILVGLILGGSTGLALQFARGHFWVRLPQSLRFAGTSSVAVGLFDAYRTDIFSLGVLASRIVVLWLFAGLLRAREAERGPSDLRWEKTPPKLVVRSRPE